MSKAVQKVCGGWVVVGGWWWLSPILVFSLSQDQAEQYSNFLYFYSWVGGRKIGEKC